MYDSKSKIQHTKYSFLCTNIVQIPSIHEVEQCKLCGCMDRRIVGEDTFTDNGIPVVP